MSKKYVLKARTKIESYVAACCNETSTSFLSKAQLFETECNAITFGYGIRNSWRVVPVKVTISLIED